MMSPMSSFLKGGVRLIAQQQVALDEDLDIALLVAQVGKAGLPMMRFDIIRPARETIFPVSAPGEEGQQTRLSNRRK